MNSSHRDPRTSRPAGTPSGHRAKSRTRRIVIGGGALASAAAVTVAVTVASASQDSRSTAGADHAVFVQGNELSGNTIHAFARGDDGTLSPSGTYATGGKGGDQVDAPTDSLASQGSLVYDDVSGMLLAVNAGSGTVTSFRVEGQQLKDRRVVDSGGEFPASVAVHGAIAYVMNAGGEGSIQGFKITSKGLKPLKGSHRSLGLDNEDLPLFSSSPGEVEFTPDGRNLVVTTKSNNTVEVFPMKRNGLPAVAEPVLNESAGGVPFAISFDKTGKRMVVAEAEKSTVTTYQVKRDGRLKVLQEPLANGQETLCWLERAGNYFYGGNTGNSTVTGYRMDKGGRLSLTNEVGIATPPSANSQGVIDLAVTEDEKFVYVQNAVSGTVDGFRVEANGALTKVTTAEGLPAFDESGMEGIAAV
ncbi:lactonase family protein [Streptomyces montanus]|uniref:Lactonase family protein n=1 Tax=Streptomyces montanus TaxID=2580423 RepID=A0A5R9FFZ0_9ACTN|nr:beta-propeller fold lactonase family protein [Streptomyces montanus]TLS42697.1 lactonase family protein [Streptomyces montanus]